MTPEMARLRRAARAVWESAEQTAAKIGVPIEEWSDAAAYVELWGALTAVDETETPDGEAPPPMTVIYRPSEGWCQVWVIPRAAA